MTPVPAAVNMSERAIQKFMRLHPLLNCPGICFCVGESCEGYPHARSLQIALTFCRTAWLGKSRIKHTIAAVYTHLLKRHHWHPSPPIPAHSAANSPTQHRRSTSFSPILIFNPIVSPPLPQREQQSTIKMSWSQSNNRTCGGPRPSGRSAVPAEGALPFTWARILSISPVVRHSLFNTGYDLNLTGAPLAGLDVDPDAAQLNTRLSRCIQVIDWRRSAGVLSSQFSPVG